MSLYGDIPYATEFGWPPWMTGEEAEPLRDIDAYWARFVPEGYTPRSVELNEDQQRGKAEAMRTYRTQFAVLESGRLRRLTHPAVLPFALLWVERF